jgi:hypothetical protein
VVFAAAADSRDTTCPHSQPAVAKLPAIEGLDQPRLPAIWDFYDGLVAVQVDSAHTTTILTGIVAERQDL